MHNIERFEQSNVEARFAVPGKTLTAPHQKVVNSKFPNFGLQINSCRVKAFAV